MAFNLTAELQLQANNQNINQVVNQIQQQLRPIGDVNIKVNTDTKAVQQAANQVQRLDKGFRSTQKSASELNRTLVESARRFSVITVATGSLLSLVNAFKNSVKSALDFEVELAKISQVTGKTVKELSGLSTEVRKLSTELGVGNASLIETSRILLQTGLSAQKTKQALDVLARTTLAATFDDIQDTTEGAIALLNQFGGVARKTGQDIAFLEDSLDAINAVSKKFAVESSDLIGVVRRVGGVFSAAGGDVKELIALFTSVRQTTRESAETISTGLRTIFTRLQRTDTVDALRDLNIELQDSRGQFVGAFEAVKRLSVGLSALDPKDFRFSAIVEELGGFRQVGKVIPLIKQFAVAQNALNVAQNASGSILADSITAQQTLANRFAKTREKFDELIAQFADSSTFRSLANGFLTIADSLIKIGSALEPVLPLLTALFALKVGSGLASGIGLLRGISGGGGGGSGPIFASRFATGGPVPGSGNRDTVPAMLTPGEFVIRKSSVNKIGMNNLSQMNAKGYASGGPVGNYRSGKPYVEDPITTLIKNKGTGFNAGEGSTRRKATRFNSSDELQFKVNRENFDVSKVDQRFKEAQTYFNAKTTSERGIAFEAVVEKALKLQKSDQANSRIDAKKGKKLYEFKSTISQSNENAIGEKLLGAALNPIGKVEDPDSVAKKRLTSAVRLNEEPNTVNLGEINLIQDTTKGLGKGTKDAKDALNQTRKKNFASVQKAALGGLIQKFAAGGAVQSILKQNKVGAANLDEGKDNDVKLGVNLARINATDPVKNNNFLKNFAGVSKYIESQGVSKTPRYTLKRNSLEKSTGDRFRANIVSEVTNAADLAAGKVGKDLIGTPVKASEEAKKVLSQKLVKEGGVIGSVFEDVLNIVANRGDFSPTSQFQPFDFPNGLTGPLADNFKGLPSAFVDARKRQTSKDKATFETKIANQIALEAAASPFGKANIPAKGSKKAQQAALGGMIKRLARGGSAGGDTVPALLTPGEFVLNKKAAQGIGAAKLDAMNKRGEVQGFNKGGSVQYLARGGRPTGGSLGLSGQTVNPNAFGGIVVSLTNVADAFASIGVGAEKFATIAELVETALGNGATEAEAFNIAMDEVVRSSNEAKDAATAQAAAQEELRTNPRAGNTVASDEQLSSAQNVGSQLGITNAATGQTSTQAVVQAAGKDEAVRQQLAEVQKQEIAAITREIRSIDQGVSISDAKARAEAVVENSYGVLAKNIEVQKTLGQKLKEKTKALLTATADRAKQLKKGGVKGALSGAKQGFAKGSQAAAQGLAGAQNLAFAGAAIGGVVASLGVFEEATNKAASQAIAFGTTSLGLVATVAQTIAGFTAQAAASTASATASQAQAIASGQATAADLAESSASFGAAGAIGIFVIALTAAVSVLYFWSAQAKAQAEQSSKEFDAAFKSIGDGATGVAQKLKDSATAEINSRAESAKAFSTSSVSTVAAFTIAGAAIGSIVPGIGNAIGAAIGAVAGAVAGLVVASSNVKQALSEEQKAIIQETDKRNKAIDSLVALSEAVNSSKQAFDQIEKTVGLSEVRGEGGFKESTLRKQAQTAKDIQVVGGDQFNEALAEAEATVGKISQRTGLSAGELGKKDAAEIAKAISTGDSRNLEKRLEESTKANKAAFKAAKDARRQFGSGSDEEAEALATLRQTAKTQRDNVAEKRNLGQDDTAIFAAAKAFQIASLTIEKRAELFAKNLTESGSQLADLLSDAPVDAAFEDLVKEGTAIGNAFKIRAAALRASSEEQNRLDKNQIENLRAKETLTNQEQLALDGFVKSVNERAANTERQIQEERDLFEKGQKSRNENAIAIREESAARVAIIQALKAQEIALRDANQALIEAKNVNAGLEFDIAALGDGKLPIASGTLDLESPIPEDVIANVKKFGNSLGNLTAKQQKQAQGAIDQVISSQIAASKLFDSLAGKGTVGIGGTANEILANFLPDVKDIDKFLLSAFANVPEQVEAFKAQLTDAAKTGGTLTAEELSQLVEPIKEAGGKAGESLKLFNDVLNTQRQRTELIIQKENEIRQKGLEAIDLYNDQVLKGASIIAEAEGRDPDQGKSDRILAASQRRLDAGKAGRGGLDIDATNAAGLAQTKRDAILRKKVNTAQIKVLNDRIAAGEKLNKADEERLSKLQKARNEEINTIKDVTEAQKSQTLALDSQISLVANNLKKASEAIKLAKEQTFAVVSEFVVGGKEARKSLNTAAAGIINAVQTGTLQNQTEKQRAQTVSLLDKLQDVQIGNTGLTGKEVKQELIFRDAIRLGFPPEVASSLALSTSIEEDMLSQLKELVRLSQNSAVAAGAFSSGGVVYRSNGGSIFQPKGTDTVPAMLTPGEFVIRKSAVDKVGVGALSAINQGQPIYRANGSKKPEEPFDLDKALNATPNASINEAKQREAQIAKYEAIFAKNKKEREAKAEKDRFDSLTAGSDTPFSDFKRIEDTQAAANKLKAEQDAKVITRPAPEIPSLLEKGETVEDVIARGRARNKKIQAEAARPFQENFGDIDAARQKVFDDEFKAEQAAKKKAAEPEKVRNIAATAYEEAIAQGFSKEYSTNAGFKAVDAAKIVKIPAKGNKPATFYGRADVIGLVEKNTAVNNAPKPDGSRRKQSRSDELKAFEANRKQKRKEQEDLVATRKPSTGPKDFSGKALDGTGQRRISPQARRRLQRSGGGGGGSSPIGQANAARQAFIIQAYKDGWADKSGDDRRGYLFAGDSGYRNALKGVGGFTGEQYYAYANYAIQRYIQQQKAVESSPEADKQAPASTAAEANEAASKKAGQLGVPGDDSIRQGGYIRGLGISTQDANGNQRDLGPWKGRKDGLTSEEYQLGKADPSQRARNNLIKQGYAQGVEERPGELARIRNKRAEAKAERESFDPLALSNNEKTSNSGPVEAGGRQSTPTTLPAQTISPTQRTGIGSKRVKKRENFAQGGGVAGSDIIPAMLTPGEFVMSREAVQRNGVGYMRNLNKGVVQGFRRGGLVGTGNVRYRAGGSNDAEGAGGSLSIDPSGLQQVLTDFGASFGETVDNVVAAFSTINTSLDKLANAINQGMTVTHQFSGDMKMAFKIENGDQLKNSIAEALTPKISKIISEEVSKQLGQNDFKAGG